jgi:ribosomal protein L7/L12
MTMPRDIYERVALLEAQVRYLSERAQIPLPDFRTLGQSQVPIEVQQLLASGNKIGAIKAYREATGADLATAKRFVDSLEG